MAMACLGGVELSLGDNLQLMRPADLSDPKLQEQLRNDGYVRSSGRILA